MKKKIIIIFCIVIGIIILSVASISIFIKLQLNQSFPERKEEFEMQGGMYSTVAYYYNPCIYTITYNPIRDAIVYGNAKDTGMNWILIKAMYNGSEDGEIIGNDSQAERTISRSIEIAHKQGLNVFLVPFVDSHDYWVLKRWTLEPEEWKPVVIKWAEFAEKHDVEMFAPGIEMNLIFEPEEVAPYFKNILPEIENVYSGKIAVSENGFEDHWVLLEQDNALVGYDCVGISLFPNENNDIRNEDELKQHVEMMAQRVTDTADAYDIDCKIVAPLGQDIWQKEWPQPDTRAFAYSISLDVLKEYDFDGVFIHMWLSETANPHIYQFVGPMLKQRWTYAD